MTEKFTQKTLVEVRDRAIKAYTSAPTRQRLEGMFVDLTDSEKITLSYFDACVTVLNRMGVLDLEKLDESVAKRFTAVQEALDDGVVRHNFTPQK